MTAALPHNDAGFEEQAMVAAVALCEAMARTLGIARALIDSGRQMDLVGLDTGIGLLCAKSLDLPPEMGRRLRPSLIAVLNDLDAITLALGRHATG